MVNGTGILTIVGTRDAGRARTIQESEDNRKCIDTLLAQEIHTSIDTCLSLLGQTEALASLSALEVSDKF